MKISSRIPKVPGTRAQAIVEFAIVLTVLMMVLVGLLEVGRLMFMYAAINNASREAARYASAYGLDDSGNLKYQYCDGIRNMAQRSAFFTPLAVTISYDHGPGTTAFDTCDGTVDTGVAVNSGTNLDRVYVTVSANYSPMLNLIPIGSRTITSVSARTIIGYADLDIITSSSASTPTSSVPTTPGTTVPTETATITTTAITPSDTPTATASGPFATATLWPTSTPTLVPTITSTPTVTLTPTETSTPTETFTPTLTPTAVPGCGSISTGSLMVVSNTMYLSITNPHDTLTVQSVQVAWNATNGGAGHNTLALKNASLGGVFWAGTDTTGNLTITPSTSVTIPGNNQTSTILFTFDKTYQTKNGAESIVISLSTPGCEGITIHKP